MSVYSPDVVDGEQRFYSNLITLQRNLLAFGDLSRAQSKSPRRKAKAGRPTRSTPKAKVPPKRTRGTKRPAR